MSQGAYRIWGSWRATALVAMVLTVPPAVPSHAAHANTISSYQVVFESVHDPSGTQFIAVRRYLRNSLPYLLVVNPQTLESSAVLASAAVVEGPANVDALQETTFVRALHRYTSPPFQLQNYGAIHASHSVDGLYLTVDMDPCPRPMDREMFRQVIASSESARGRVPVALAVTGRWLQKHPRDLEWLKQQVRMQRLAIIWVNHSFHHPYTPDVALDHNFLLSPGVRFEDEVLRTEMLMLENDLTPSPFFRFPGLVANGGLIERLQPLSLIPIGSDAWLAKGEVVTPGSFVLVHANGNDALGVNRLIYLLHADPGIKFLSLPTAFTNE